MKKSILTKEEEKAFQKAVGLELYASHFYLYAASCTQRKGLFGFQSYFEKEAKDELKHYKGIRNILNDFGCEAEMPLIEEVDFESDEPMDILQEAYQMELDLLGHYESMASDFSPKVMQSVLSYIEIQRLSVGEYGDLIARLSVVGDDKCGLLIFDQELKEKGN